MVSTHFDPKTATVVATVKGVDYGTYSDDPIARPGCKKLAVYAEAYAHDEKIFRIVCSSMNQDAITIAVIAHGSIIQDILRKPNQVLEPVFVS